MTDRVQKYADWLIANKDKAGTPEFATVADAYKSLRSSSKEYAQPAPPPGVTIHTATGDQHVGSDGKLTPATPAETEARFLRQKRGIGGDIAESALRGVPFIGGVVPQIGAGVRSALGSETYSDALVKEKARAKTFDADYPKTSMTGQIAGGVASTLPVAVPIAGFVGRAATGAGAIGRSALVSAGFGAPDAAIRADGGVGAKAKAGLIGGFTGASIGAALPVVGKGVSYVVNKIADALRVRGQLGSIGLTPESAAPLIRALESDNTLGQAGTNSIRAAGRNAMVADAGPNAKQLVDYIASKGGPAGSTVLQRVNARASAELPILNRTLNRTLGGEPTSVNAITSNLRTGTAAARGSAYDAAYARPIDYSAPAGRTLESLLERVPASAIRKANELMAIEGVRSRQIIANIADDGSVTFRRMPDVRQFDYITRGLRDVADELDGQGKLGGTTDVGRAISGLSRQIRRSLRTSVPEYGRALETAADPISKREALLFGNKLLSKSVTRGDVAEEVADMTGPQLEYVARGIREKIDDAIAAVNRIASDPNIDAREVNKVFSELSSRAAREKISAVIPERAARLLFGRLDQAERALQLRAAVAQNSKTFPRQAMDESVKTLTEPGMLQSLVSGRPIESGRKMLSTALGQSPERTAAITDRHLAQIADFLTGLRGANAVAAPGRLESASRVMSQNTRAADNAGLAAALAASGAYPASRPLQQRQ
jgi:hypothetical protein